MARIRKPVHKASVEFTLNELSALEFVIYAGWADGEIRASFEGVHDTAACIRAMKKVSETAQRLMRRSCLTESNTNTGKSKQVQ